MKELIVITYICYLLVTIGLTIWVARVLFKNGKRFLLEIFHGDDSLATSVNNLLRTGFYLINMGYALMTMKTYETVETYSGMMELLSVKVGTIILVLGGMHFFNLFVLFRLRKRAKNAIDDKYDQIIQQKVYGASETS